MTKAITHNEFAKIVSGIDQTNPSSEDIQTIRSALAGNPKLVREACELSKQAQYAIIYGSNLPPVTREIASAMMEELEREFGYQDAPVLERLAIDQVLLCYLRLNYWELAYSTAMAGNQMTWGQSTQWEKLVGSAQKRYIRAVECLARIRRLGISIQVNIANEGGQQINLNRS